MHITVLGATGKIGHHVVQQLLAQGHQVSALVRDSAKLTIADPALTVHVGQLTDPGVARAAVKGSDAVISTLGPTLKPGAKGTQLTDGTHTVITAMREAGVRRFIGLATPSLPDPRDRPNFRGKVLPKIAGLTMPHAIAELTGMTAAATQSDLDWTIARITNPTDQRAKGTVRAGFLGVDKVGWKMSRADIAAFLISQLADTTYLRAAPAISN